MDKSKDIIESIENQIRSEHPLKKVSMLIKFKKPKKRPLIKKWVIG